MYLSVQLRQVAVPHRQVSVPHSQVLVQQRQVSVPHRQVSVQQRQVSVQQRQVSVQHRQVSLALAKSTIFSEIFGVDLQGSSCSTRNGSSQNCCFIFLFYKKAILTKRDSGQFLTVNESFYLLYKLEDVHDWTNGVV